MTKDFNSFFQAGFECSSHRRRDGVRLDLIRATGHDKHVEQDYRQCHDLGSRAGVEPQHLRPLGFSSGAAV